MEGDLRGGEQGRACVANSCGRWWRSLKDLWIRRSAGLVPVAVLVAIQVRTTPFQVDQRTRLVHVEPIGTSRIRAANAVWWQHHPGFKSPILRTSKALPCCRGRAFFDLYGLRVAVWVGF